METAETATHLEMNLMSLGIYVERHAIESETLHVEYETANDGLTTGDLGYVCAELQSSHEAGWEPIDCHFWVFDTEFGFYGEWVVRAGWLRALERGDISETDFSTLVLSAREPADEPPAEMPAFGIAPSQ